MRKGDDERAAAPRLTEIARLLHEGPVASITLETMAKGVEFDFETDSHCGKVKGQKISCQKIADGADWFVPRTGAKLWLSNQLWRILPCTPWKNMMIEVPLKAANSAFLKDRCS